LTGHLERLRQAARLSVVYPVRGRDGSQLWYLIRSGHVLAALPRPTTEPARLHTFRVLEQAFAGPPGAAGTLNSQDLDSVQLVASWFRRFPAESARALSPEQALALCQPVVNDPV
jgi:hypothetical protein